MRSVQVVFFASARDAAGCERAEIRWEGDASLAPEDLWALLGTQFPRLAAVRPGMRLARNLEYLTGREPVFSGDEVAVIPPVSGG